MDQKGDWQYPMPNLDNEKSNRFSQEHVWYQQATLLYAWDGSVTSHRHMIP